MSVVSIGYLAHWIAGTDPHAAHGGSSGIAGAGYAFSAAIFELMNIMWIGVVAGIIAMGFLSRVPRDFVMAALGSGRGVQGIFRAAFAGVLLDLCSHGILMVGAKFYERGATIGQVMAFLIASPWNSLSLTLVLIALIGLKWTLAFIVISMVIGIVTGILFDHLVARGVLPPNPNHRPLTTGFQFWPAAKKGLAGVKWTPRFIWDTLVIGIKDSKMIVRWLFVGVIIAAALRAGVSADMFAQWFGPTMLGLGATLVAATIIEVCSEGAAPIAGDLFGRAGAIGNSFTFLMAGVATDYTEIMVLRETTKSWKIALFLPLLTVPQVLVVGYIMNQFGG
ncbi:MAG: permease [Alphaproteobacteria bacterium]